VLRYQRHTPYSTLTDLWQMLLTAHACLFVSMLLWKTGKESGKVECKIIIVHNGNYGSSLGTLKTGCDSSSAWLIELRAVLVLRGLARNHGE
jgi:hypothetical protein